MNDPTLAESFAPLPPDTPILDVLATVARQVQVKTGKPASFLAVPRKLAVVIAGDRAAQVGKPLLPSQMQALLDGRLQEVLLVIPGPTGQPLPVVCLPMVAPLAGGWNWPLPRYARDGIVCEHPEYPSLPFSTQMWDNDQKEEIPHRCNKLRQFIADQAKRHATVAHQPVTGQFEAARPLQMPTPAQAERLPEDPMLAWATLEAGLEEKAADIRGSIERKGAFGMEFDGELPEEVLTNLKDSFLAKFQCLVTYGPHPAKEGWFALVATPTTLAYGPGAE
jgi:hypothetical protein